MKKTLFFNAAALAAFMAQPLAAQLKYDNASGGSVTLYGQFNPAWQSVDDGVEKYNNLVDSTHSNSRVGLWVRQPTSAGQFSFNFETALGLRQSNMVSQNFKPDALHWRRVNIRKVDFALETDRAGKFYFGQGSMASDLIAHSDLSGTALVIYSAIGDSSGGFRFRDTTGALTGPTIGAATPDFDGGRRGRIRYDSPSFSGFTVSASYGEEILAQNVDFKATDITLRYKGEFGATKMVAGLAYAHRKPNANTTLKDTLGSFSLLHESGFNFTMAAGSRQNAGSYTYAKFGYQADWLAVGKTALAIDYYHGRDTGLTNGSRAKVLGVGAVQKFDSQNVEAYLGLRKYEYSQPGTAYQDISSLFMGARWRF
ncbi:porin [Primorskyibacter sp. S87]|uniref:porin n=1 Tax=Primorskyibacter sp. S87 TaxID=3415126 RepID=UPI003C7AA94C